MTSDVSLDPFEKKLIVKNWPCVILCHWHVYMGWRSLCAEAKGHVSVPGAINLEI